ncbi:MAG TPA: glycosyltransferase family 4 protein [Candidatus Acidoferrales bacterium]|nr:glycosyltransferase family 4 protein [Candidatus Acidoferrales bacterium]
MKVLHIIKTAVGATWAYHQIRVLRSMGIDVEVALPSDTEGLAPRYREAGIKVVAVDLDFPARRPWELPSVLRRCRQLVERVQPDLIHTHHVGTTLALRLALGKDSPTPRLFQVAGPLHLESPFFANLDMRTAGPRDHWIATCQWTWRKYLSLGVEPERVSLSYAGIEVTPFGTARNGRLRAELGMASDTPLVGMVAYMYGPKWFLGQRRGLKGHEDFISALNLARRELPQIKGVIVGGAWDARWYEERLRRYGQTICNGSLAFLGTRADVPELYPDLDLAVVPSHSENCGGAVEPLLSGVPVVATDVGGLPDLIRDGKTGWLVPPRNPVALAHSIVEVLRNKPEAKRRASAGMSLALQLFDVQRTAHDVVDTYNGFFGAEACERQSTATA